MVQIRQQDVNRQLLVYYLQDANKVCNPDIETPFSSISDAVERLLPYHIFQGEDVVTEVAMQQQEGIELAITPDAAVQQEVARTISTVCSSIGAIQQQIEQLAASVQRRQMDVERQIMYENLVSTAIKVDNQLLRQGYQLPDPGHHKAIPQSPEAVPQSGVTTPQPTSGGETPVALSQPAKMEEKPTELAVDHKKISFGFTMMKPKK